MNAIPLLVPPFVLMVILPVVPFAGAVTVNWVALALVTVAATPLKVTVLSVGVVLKFDPLMVTIVLAGPDVGLMEVIAGGEEAE